MDGKKVATQHLEGSRPGRFFDEVYPLPADLTEGKEKVTVRFQAHSGCSAGGIFDLRIMTKS